MNAGDKLRLRKNLINLIVLKIEDLQSVYISNGLKDDFATDLKSVVEKRFKK